MDSLKPIGVFAAALLFVLCAVFLSRLIDKSTGADSVITSSSRPVVSCDPNRLDYNSVSANTNQVVDLISSNKTMSAKDGKFVDSTVIVTKAETKNSKVACGYLFVRAGTTKYGALKPWENIYINPNGFGGHIDKNSAFSINDGDQYSEYIYSLDKVQYWRTRDDHTILTADWASLLNVSSEVNFMIGLNTEEPTGFVSKISIAYKCWNPETGEENTGCKLTADPAIQQ